MVSFCGLQGGMEVIMSGMTRATRSGESGWSRGLKDRRNRRRDAMASDGSIPRWGSSSQDALKGGAARSHGFVRGQSIARSTKPRTPRNLNHAEPYFPRGLRGSSEVVRYNRNLRSVDSTGTATPLPKWTNDQSFLASPGGSPSRLRHRYCPSDESGGFE